MMNRSAQSVRDEEGVIDPLYAEWLSDNIKEWPALEDRLADEELAADYDPDRAKRIEQIYAEMEIIEFARLAEYEADDEWRRIVAEHDATALARWQAAEEKRRTVVAGEQLLLF